MNPNERVKLPYYPSGDRSKWELFDQLRLGIDSLENAQEFEGDHGAKRFATVFRNRISRCGRNGLLTSEEVDALLHHLNDTCARLFKEKSA